MDSWIIGIIVAAAQTVVTTVVGLLIKYKWDKEKKDKEELERLREEQRAQSENQRCNLVKEAVHEEVVQLETKVREEFSNFRSEVKKDIQPLGEDMELMKKAMQKDVRRSLRQDGKMLVDRGWATQLEKTEFDELYWAYHNLGRNGVVDALHDQVMHLSETKPKTKTTKKVLVENK